ncbi:uncharacterized protein TNCV_1795111 [Trichonephila clavipes]|nr:uncharacterized protein TNCV_1795111 [Trichonephila clavipes]
MNCCRIYFYVDPGFEDFMQISRKEQDDSLRAIKVYCRKSILKIQNSAAKFAEQISGLHTFYSTQTRLSVPKNVAVVAEWYRYRTVACFVTGSSPVPLKTRRVGQRCTLNLSRAETSSRWCGVVVRRGGASSGVVHVT